MDAKDLFLKTVTEQYLGSPDFNGLSLSNLIKSLALSEDEARDTVVSLIREGLVSLNFDINPHIKRFPLLPEEKQIEKLVEVDLGYIVVYPSVSHLKQVVDPVDYGGRPFTLRLALGEPQLTSVSFDLRVLEFYRNDPQYDYRVDDISGSISVLEETGITESDNVLLQSFGFSYDANYNRAVAVYLRYLTGLSPQHQQLWSASILGDEYKLHPDYFRTSILGEWGEGVSVFDAFVAEQYHINEMCKLMSRPPFFRREFTGDDKPKGFGFLLRPTLKEFNDFVHLLDKMMSENINKKFFQGEVALEDEEVRPDGKVVIKPKGTIRLLADWLRARFKPSGPAETRAVEEMIGVFKQVRKLRQKPAHAVKENVFDQKYFREQRKLMRDAYLGMTTLRQAFQLHPYVRGYKIPNWLQSGTIWME